MILAVKICFLPEQYLRLVFIVMI